MSADTSSESVEHLQFSWRELKAVTPYLQLLGLRQAIVALALASFNKPVSATPIAKVIPIEFNLGYTPVSDTLHSLYREDDIVDITDGDLNRQRFVTPLFSPKDRNTFFAAAYETFRRYQEGAPLITVQSLGINTAGRLATLGILLVASGHTPTVSDGVVQSLKATQDRLQTRGLLDATHRITPSGHALVNQTILPFVRTVTQALRANGNLS